MTEEQRQAAAVADIKAGLESISRDVKARLALAQDQKAKIDEHEARLRHAEQQLVSERDIRSSATSYNSNEIAAQMADNDAFAMLKSGHPTTGRQTVGSSIHAALTNPGRGQSGGTVWPGVPERHEGLHGFAQPGLTLLDILPVQKVETGVLEFIELDGYVNAVDYQRQEGDEKAATDLPAKVSRAEIATLAHWLPASLQVLEDNEELTNMISLVLGVSLRQKLELELLVGEGGQGEIKGLLEYAPRFQGVGDVAADLVGQAITDLEAAGWKASAIVMNPTDWFTISSQRGDDGHYVMGSPRDPAPPSLWNRPVILNASMPYRAALVLDTSQVALLDRQQVTIEASRFDGSNFRKNMVTILAELRAGLAVYAPSALRLVDIFPEDGELAP